MKKYVNRTALTFAQYKRFANFVICKWCLVLVNGNVERKLTGVKSGINRKIMIPPAGYFCLNLKDLVPLNLKQRFSAS
jgi:hypothetical protein